MPECDGINSALRPPVPPVGGVCFLEAVRGGKVKEEGGVLKMELGREDGDGVVTVAVLPEPARAEERRVAFPLGRMVIPCTGKVSLLPVPWAK